MHILFLSDNFPPEVNAPASRTYEHCREWVRAGHKVTVVTCAPNFPTGKVFAGYRNRLYQGDAVEGIRVIRVWSYITANEGFLRRTLDYVSYMASAIAIAPFVRDVDVVVATSPQFFTACAGWFIGAVKRRPFVFELRDLWPESIRAVGAMRDGAVLRALERLELFLYRRAAAIVTVTHSFRTRLIALGIDGAKIAVVTNGADLARFGPRDKDPVLVEALGLGGKLVAGYIGTHGMAHALETLLEAAAIIERDPRGADLRLLFLGDGAAKAALRRQAQAMGLRNVVFVDSVPKSEVTRYWSLLDLSIIHLKRTELFTTVIPSKLFECMAMGIPILHGVEGESAAIVEAERVGLTFRPEDSRDLADKLLRLAGDAEARQSFALRSVEAARRYDRAYLAASMLGVLQQLAHRRAPVAAVESPKGTL